MDIIKIYCSFLKFFVAFYNRVCYTIRVEKKRGGYMTVEDIYRITSPTQNVDIYNPKIKVFVFTGVCSDIPLACLDIPVSQVVAADNTLVIMVE